MRAFRRRSALPMAEAFDLGPAGQLAHTAKTWGTSVLATVASDGPAVRLSKRCSAMADAVSDQQSSVIHATLAPCFG